MSEINVEDEAGVQLLRLLGKLTLKERRFSRILQTPNGRSLYELASRIQESKLLNDPTVQSLEDVAPLTVRK